MVNETMLIVRSLLLLSEKMTYYTLTMRKERKWNYMN